MVLPDFVTFSPLYGYIPLENKKDLFMKKIVVSAGGTGGFMVLQGLRDYPFEITGIPPTFDSGDSTGILRDTRGALPQGDVRRHILGLARGGDDFLRSLLNFRFSKVENGSGVDGLSDHSLGNLILHGATKICGGEVEAIKKISELLKIEGKVVPVSTNHSELCAELEDGEVVRGETNIDRPKHDGSKAIRRIFLSPDAIITRDAYKAIVEADVVVKGPGDLFTSILPNVLVKGFVEALDKSSAKIVYVVNIMTKWGETHGFTAEDFCAKVLEYLRRDKFDFVIVNNQTIRADLLKKYSKENAFPVKYSLQSLRTFGKQIIEANLLQESDIVRHDSKILGRIIAGL